MSRKVSIDKNRALKARNQKLTEELNDLKKMQFHVREERLEVSLSQHAHNHTHSVTVSDLPPPEVFDRYPEELKALILKRIETDMENDKALVALEKEEQVIRKLESSGEFTLKSRGQIFAFSSLILLLGAAIYFGTIGAFKIAGSIVAVTIIGSITAFTGFGSSGNKKSESEENTKK